MRELMEVATGEAFDEFTSDFVRGPKKRSREHGRMGDVEKHKIAVSALESAGKEVVESTNGRRMKVAQAAISRRLTEGKKSTFGHQPRTQAYGRKRWKTHTAALLAAERMAMNE